MNKTMSLKQIEANRRNAQKSTGPKTPNGRAFSKMNALKHGLLSKEALVRGIHARESKREFHALLARFRADLNPVGPVEEMLVDEIVTTHWRLRRALKAESGEIALSVDNGQWNRSRRHPEMQWDDFGDPVRSMRYSAFGNHFLYSALSKVRASVEKEGELTEAAIQSVIFHGEPYSLTKDLEELRLQLQQNPEGLEPLALRAKQKKQALAYLDQKLGLISWSKSNCEEREKMEEEALQMAEVLPPMKVLDKILRYETQLKRQLFRAMMQLERVQRMRLGEAVPPPLTMEVTNEH
jgi:hypothetical protein